MPITIALPDIDARAPLYDRYPREVNPQDAYLWIDLEADTAGWSTNGEIGNAVPVAVWHGVTRRVPCSNTLTGQQIAELTEELRPLIERVCAGGDSEWDGQNWVGAQDDASTDAEADIRRILSETEGGAAVWQADEWLNRRDEIAAIRQRVAGGSSIEEALADEARECESGAVLADVVLDDAGDDVIDVLRRWWVLSEGTQAHTADVED